MQRVSTLPKEIVRAIELLESWNFRSESKKKERAMAAFGQVDCRHEPRTWVVFSLPRILDRGRAPPGDPGAEKRHIRHGSAIVGTPMQADHAVGNEDPLQGTFSLTRG
jgi:hypothetical protein